MSTTPTDLAMEMVAASMGYALVKLSEDPGWLRSLAVSGSNLEVALRPDAEEFREGVAQLWPNSTRHPQERHSRRARTSW